jgi:hypothetical protein
MSRRDKPQRERLSDKLRRETEKPWQQDPYLSSAGDGPGVWVDDGDRDDS